MGGRIWTVRRAIAIVGLLALGLTSCGDDGDDEASLSRIRVAAIPAISVVSWPLVAADEEGCFAEQGIEVDFSFTFDALTLLASGEVDLSMDSADSGLTGALRGVDVVFVAPLVSLVTIGVIGGAGIEEPEDLEGETVGVTGVPSTDQFVVQRYLEQQGVDINTIDFVGIEDDGARRAQLEGGQLAAIRVGGEEVAALQENEEGDLSVIATSADLGSYPWNFAQTTRSYASQNAETLTGYLTCVSRGVDFVQDPNNKDTVIDYVTQASEGVDREVVVAGYEAYAPDFALYEIRPLTTDDLQPGLEFLEFSEQEDVESLDDLDSLIDNSFVEAATQ